MALEEEQTLVASQVEELAEEALQKAKKQVKCLINANSQSFMRNN